MHRRIVQMRINDENITEAYLQRAEKDQNQ